MLSPSAIQAFYVSKTLTIPSLWNASRKHFRVKLGDGKFVKLTHFQNRLSAKDVKFLCWKLKPWHLAYAD